MARKLKNEIPSFVLSNTLTAIPIKQSPKDRWFIMFNENMGLWGNPFIIQEQMQLPMGCKIYELIDKTGKLKNSRELKDL